LRDRIFDRSFEGTSKIKQQIPMVKKICFVISPIGEEESETRKRSDQVLKHIITGPVHELGYEVIRADKISEPGIITSQIIQYIVDADLVVADLTERNPNVFYELAIRHAIRKPLVQLIRKGEAIPFDVAATRIIPFDIHNLDSVAAAKDELVSQVKSLEAGRTEVHNPISASLDLKMLKESGNAEERSLADVVEAIGDLRTAVTSLDKRMNGPESMLSSKLNTEIKEILDSLPGRIESRLDGDKRRRRKFPPMIFDEIMHTGMDLQDSNVGFLMMVSFLRDDFPWIYEIGIETYRGIKAAKTKAEKKKIVEPFIRAFEMIGHPAMRDYYGKSDDSYMFSKDIRHFMQRYIERYLLDGKTDV
jgi:hypothetical protein